MISTELKKKIEDGALSPYKSIYFDIEAQKKRFIDAIESFERLYGEGRDISVFSVPGRSEISGNHTDHNRGRVLAGAIDRDIIAVAATNDDGLVRIHSEGYPEDVISLDEISAPERYKKGSSSSLIAGVLFGMQKRGYTVGGYDAYLTSEVLKGSGISSSAAYEVMIGNILNHLYNGGKAENKELAHVAKFAENEYFGKPCGLMDQMACAVGGFVYIDFENAESPIVESIPLALSDYGYSLCIVNTGGNHADLTPDYAAVPEEMRSVARLFDRDVLRGLSEEDILKNVNSVRDAVGDRALLRALHFVRENDRVLRVRDCLERGEVDGFLSGVRESGRSSFEYLQNVYTTVNVREQGISLALCITDGFLSDKSGACRVHGGGFAGTMQAFVRVEHVDSYIALMNSFFGEGAAQRFNIRGVGAVKLF